MSFFAALTLVSIRVMERTGLQRDLKSDFRHPKFVLNHPLSQHVLYRIKKETSAMIYFEKANITHIDIIFQWLAEPHMMKFWDNTPEHKEDILNFIHGRKQHYFEKTTCYWVGLIEKHPFCFVLSDVIRVDQILPDLLRQHLSPKGTTIALDFGIGNTHYLGQGLSAPSLNAFVNFYHQEIDPLADTFFIDPDQHHHKAQHVYSKAGFNKVGEFTVNAGAFKGQVSYLMVKKL